MMKGNKHENCLLYYILRKPPGINIDAVGARHGPPRGPLDGGPGAPTVFPVAHCIETTGFESAKLLPFSK